MRTLGRYELLEPIGSGGMARVYLGRVRGVGGFERMVAVKVCHPHLREDVSFVRRFLDEARLAAKIRHPNVVATLDCGEDGEDLYLVMEWIEGDRLSGLVERGPLPPPIATRIVCDALAGLHAAHELGSVHRDVSPQNVLVGVDGVTRIADFGLAKALGAATISHDGELRGKVAYMAPEQILGGTLGPAIDVWAAGVVLWEALVGERLFARETEAETINAVLRFDPRPPTGIAALDAVIAKALARKPDERFASAHEMQLALEAAVPLPPSRAVGGVVRGADTKTIVTPLASPPAPPKSRKRALVAAAIVGVGTLVGIGWVVGVRSSATTATAAAAVTQEPPVAAAPASVEEIAPQAFESPAKTPKPSASSAPRPQLAKKPVSPPKPVVSGTPGYWPKEP